MDDQALTGFAARLNEVCNECDLPPERGRQVALAKVAELTPNAVRKWLKGLGLPTLQQAIKIANWSGVNVDWLLTGREPKRLGGTPWNALALDDMLRSLPIQERLEAIAMLRYELNKASTFFVREQVTRYEAALDAYRADQPEDKRRG